MATKRDNYRFIVGPAASHTYLTTDDGECQLTLDWSYNKAYFKYYREPWITLLLDSNLRQQQPTYADTDHKRLIFQQLAKATTNHPELKYSPYSVVVSAVGNLSKIDPLDEDDSYTTMSRLSFGNITK